MILSFKVELNGAAYVCVNCTCGLALNQLYDVLVIQDSCIG